MTTYGRTDANHAEIVAALRAAGAAVQSLASVGEGVPDLLVAFRGAWYVIEAKDGKKSSSRKRLTAAEKAWHEKFGACAAVHTAECVDEALTIIGAV